MVYYYINMYYLYYLSPLWKLNSDGVTAILSYLGHFNYYPTVILQKSQAHRLVTIYGLITGSRLSLRNNTGEI